MINKIKLVRVSIIVFIVVLILTLLLSDFAWLGKIKFNTNFKKFTPFVSILVPQERTDINSFAYIKQEPVYFAISLPRDFNKINFQFEYLNQGNNLIEVGMQVSESNWELKPLENMIINKIDWPKIEQDGLILFQREENFKTIDQFFQQLPSIEQIAVYNYDLIYDYKLKDYQPSQKLQNYNYQIMGPYQFYTYIKDEDLYFAIEFAASENLAATKLFVYDLQNNQLAEFGTDNNVLTAQLENLPEGAYKIELQTYSDVVTETIKTKQQYLSFNNRLEVIKPSQLFTNSQALTFFAYMNSGVQVVTINDQDLDIEEIYQQYEINPQEKINIIKIPKGNLEVTGHGLFAFSEKQFFNPLPVEIYSENYLNNNDIKYVLTYYHLPRIKNDFKINNISFDLHNALITDGNLQFVISIPDLTNVNKGIIIKNMKAQLIRPAFWQENLQQNITNYLKFYKNEIIK